MLLLVLIDAYAKHGIGKKRIGVGGGGGGRAEGDNAIQVLGLQEKKQTMRQSCGFIVLPVHSMDTYLMTE
jgi:hypothetical protein